MSTVNSVFPDGTIATIPVTGPYARIVADSITEDGCRLTTMEVRIHRFVLSEFNTHRVFSRNSASSRARPFAKVLQQISDNPAIPLVWPAEQKGMQGGEPLSEGEQQACLTTWIGARDSAMRFAGALASIGLHKSLVNRLLEPWGWQTIVVSATDWANFFDQRVSPLAQPEIKAAAEFMKIAYEHSQPTLLAEGQWHLPYVTEVDHDLAKARLNESGIVWDDGHVWRMLAKVSAARCARVSYLTQDGRRDLEEDLRLYERLVSARPWHGSPLEHVATPWPENRVEHQRQFTDLEGHHRVARRVSPRFGNFLGWRQLRLEIEAASAATPTSHR